MFVITAFSIMYQYDTMTEALNDLNRRGYTHDFNIEEDCIICHSVNHRLRPDEFEIDEVYRFDGETDPGDDNIVYAISSDKFDLKGVLVNAYGAYSEEASDELISKLKTHH